jgi:hypothetical protein
MNTTAGLRSAAWFIIGWSSALALAQAAAPALPGTFHGTWKVVWQGKSNELTSKLVLAENGGSWQTYNVSSKSDACQGREVAVAVAQAASDAVTLKLKFSEVMAGCNDVTLKLRRGDDGAISGTRSNQPVTLTRQ